MSETSEQKMDELLRLMRAAVPAPEDMNDAGRVGFVYKFDYDPTADYEILDVVLHGPSLWTPKQNTTGNAPPDQSQPGQESVRENEFWEIFLPGALGADYVKKTNISKAPTETEPGVPGINFPDGKTITINESGMMTGAVSGKTLTQKEMDEQLASGELEKGDVVYLTGPAVGENGLLVKVDKELKDSVNPVQNRVVKEALDRLDSLITETNALRATLESYGFAKISESTAVTETDSGLVLSAKEKNAAIEGTIAHEIANTNQYLNEWKAYDGADAFDNLYGNTVTGGRSLKKGGIVQIYAMIKMGSSPQVNHVVKLINELAPRENYIVIDLMEGSSDYKFVGKIWITGDGRMLQYGGIMEPGKDYYIFGTYMAKA